MTNFDTAKLRQFIQNHFSVDDLNGLMADYFRSVYEDIAPAMSKQQRVTLLLDHCLHHGRLPDLVAALQRERPTLFDPAEYGVVRNPVPVSVPAFPQPVQRNPRQVFLSHAHQDAAEARRLADDLEASGYPVWMTPDSIRPGEKWAEAINRGLEESGQFVLLLSPHAVVSKWVQTETNIAIELNHEDEMTLYPLLLQACQVPTLWRVYQHIPLRGGYEQGLSKLLEALELAAPDFTEPDSPQTGGNPLPDVNQWIHPKTGLVMLRIPAGEFLYGDEKETVYLDEFWIAKTPVTNAAYKRFLDANPSYNVPAYNWDKQRRTYSEGKADHPVVLVSWHDAKAYAAWAGMELPTEQQWEKAARGTDGWFYPWGDKWQDNYCNTKETGIKTTTPVGQFSPQGNSPYGCVDMVGNVWEWTDSPSQVGKEWRVLRGGSFYHFADSARAASRYSNVPYNRAHYSGFRVVVVRRSPSHLDH
ncbi:MAG: SUMF1/EgtB/PvdO family nonheme iron enzyme [Ardenticatenaceae bacterium]|nr:SUMF1/EgtB/PvdO family nonheme iron enzyme [Ardenticatenaceae bacterium]